VGRHQAYSETIGKILDPDGPFRYHCLSDRLSPDKLARLPGVTGYRLCRSLRIGRPVSTSGVGHRTNTTVGLEWGMCLHTIGATSVGKSLLALVRTLPAVLLVLEADVVTRKDVAGC
jgi:hypothetical protein